MSSIIHSKHFIPVMLALLMFIVIIGMIGFLINSMYKESILALVAVLALIGTFFLYRWIDSK